ncbi:universal stress family protein [Paraburkholderia fungorum]|jgi:nucleotide-binding universal stress UspA family protein|uniref:Universal stress family protein n=1 Tax=Paraburkholderia fungorum TaxID=134537 RepID=A0AAP5QK86_9BURK|nr:universal stress protein [Paraburkholderia fungorum]AJZ56548.1 universal stress family protein [Paraburkholderia fungorum]MDT8843814.1 universal stress protein [Paraburkholderia fungorum]
MTASSASNRLKSGFERIMIAVDSSPMSARVAKYACGLVSPDTEVRIVSVAENPRALVPLGLLADAVFETIQEELVRDASDAVKQANEVFADANIDVDARVVELSRLGGYAGNALIDAASEWHADLLVVGARQHHGMLRWFEGTVSEFVTNQTPCSILIVPASYVAAIHAYPRRILFALDGSEASFDALRSGLHLARPDSSIRAVYVVDRAVRFLKDTFIEEGDKVLAAAAEVFANQINPVELGLVKTDPASDDIPHTIVREAERWHADLVIVGTHGRRGFSRWFLGSVAGRTARITQTPLLMVRPRLNSSSLS